MEELINEATLNGWEVNSVSFTYNMWGYHQAFATLERLIEERDYV